MVARRQSTRLMLLLQAALLLSVGAPAQVSPEALLKEATELYASLEYDRVVPLTKALLASETASVDMRLDAQLLQGSAYAVLGNIIEAEKAFRFLLRGRPGFDMKKDTPPKILAVFRKVQVEEKTIVKELAALALNRTIAELRLTARPPTETVGGLPLTFVVDLVDPRRVVAKISVQYRKAGEAFFSSLALAPQGESWSASLPGEWTASETGFEVEYFVTSERADGVPLAKVGAPDRPERLRLEAGEPAQPAFYTSPWFWVIAGAVVLASGTAAGVVVSRQSAQLPESDLGEVRAP